MSDIITIGNYSISQHKNTVIITLPPTQRTATNTIAPVENRRESLTDDELAEILLRTVVVFQKEADDEQP